MGVKVFEKPEKSGVWWVRIFHNKQDKQKKVGSKSAANKLKKELEKAIAAKDLNLPAEKPNVPTLNDYFEGWKETYLDVAADPKTKQIYEKSFDHILPMLGEKPLNEITKQDVQELLVHLTKLKRKNDKRKRKLNKTTIGLIHRQLKSCLNWAVEDGLIEKNPAVGKKIVSFYSQAKEPDDLDPLNAQEAALFLKTAKEHYLYKRYYELFLCAIHSGLRMGELAGLEWRDIDFNGGFMRVQRQYSKGQVKPLKNVRTKRLKSRNVDLSPELAEAFRELRRRRKDDYLKKGKDEIPAWVFVTPISGNRVDMDNLRDRIFNKVLDKVLDKAGIRRITLHDLRHAYARLLLENGAPPTYVQAQLGHASIKLTCDIYGRWMEGRTHEALTMLPIAADASD